MRSKRSSEEHIDIRLDTGQLVLLGVGTLLVALLIFLLGVLVGKNMWESAKPRAAAPYTAVAETDVAEVADPLPASEPREYSPPSFYKSLPNGGNDGIDVPTESAEKPDLEAATVVVVPSKTQRVSAEPAQKQPEETNVAKEVEPTPAPKGGPNKVAVKKPASKLAPKPAAKKTPPAKRASTEYTVQVGSFTSEAQAAKHAEKVRKKSGVFARTMKATVNGKIWYRVQTGRFQSKTEADKFRREALEAKGIDGFVTKR